MVRGRSRFLWVLAVTAALALSGCGDDPAEQPDGAVQLRQNQPTTVGDVRLVAGNIWDDSIVLSVDDGDGAAENADLAVGERATIKGRSFELLSVHEDTAESAPGGSGSYAWVLPVDD
ncbi:hypothetical protein [Cellulomonas wangsupingiae]|uniref:DUF5666 domain-containing protein n=1 Tax=Cellulomonas wangsupingiae TaxID=2968085 RepID=A0ABY5K571_9CELL|nr:hypothetical protein [Cellulomonas wangsupingiae]MCC2335986.1 hypothetical protein [Cellulomonas wangsupingiae]MCM0639725.1 hypothetical protein [Cellulomonas wangsupingiae]UUI64210.1 hypothetical protein NP075_13865 [Cellulomonas wangsupingiae]